MLLLDEPLSALDGPTREALRGELRNLLSSLSIPVLLVTHDRVGALALGDQVAIVNEGRIVQHASIEEVFRRPLTRPNSAEQKAGRFRRSRGTPEEPPSRDYSPEAIARTPFGHRILFPAFKPRAVGSATARTLTPQTRIAQC
jgi:ABC-type glutathione transport system ATPase component